jgi:hypothetical protein
VAAHRRTVRCNADGVAGVTGFAVAIDARIRRGARRADSTESPWRAEITAAGAATFLPGGTADLSIATGLTDTWIAATASAGHGKRAVGVARIGVEIIVRIGSLLTPVPILLPTAAPFAAPTILSGFDTIQIEQTSRDGEGKGRQAHHETTPRATKYTRESIKVVSVQQGGSSRD